MWPYNVWVSADICVCILKCYKYATICVICVGWLQLKYVCIYDEEVDCVVWNGQTFVSSRNRMCKNVCRGASGRSACVTIVRSLYKYRDNLVDGSSRIDVAAWSAFEHHTCRTYLVISGWRLWSASCGMDSQGFGPIEQIADEFLQQIV